MDLGISDDLGLGSVDDTFSSVMRNISGESLEAESVDDTFDDEPDDESDDGGGGVFGDSIDLSDQGSGNGSSGQDFDMLGEMTMTPFISIVDGQFKKRYPSKQEKLLYMVKQLSKGRKTSKYQTQKFQYNVRGKYCFRYTDPMGRVPPKTVCYDSYDKAMEAKGYFDSQNYETGNIFNRS